MQSYISVWNKVYNLLKNLVVITILYNIKSFHMLYYPNWHLLSRFMVRISYNYYYHILLHRSNLCESNRRYFYNTYFVIIFLKPLPTKQTKRLRGIFLTYLIPRSVVPVILEINQVSSKNKRWNWNWHVVFKLL